MRRTAAAAAILLITLAAVVSRSQARAEIPVRWEGTAKVTHAFSPAVAFDAADWAGQLRDVRELRVRAKETRRSDVTDQQGRLVGQFVWLADEGTSWTGAVDDTESHLGGAIRFIAHGTGQGGAMVFGLIYQSLTTPDPLADVLPAGTYCLQVSLSPPIAYTTTLREKGRPDQVRDYKDAGQFLAGDCRLGRQIGMIGSKPTVEAIRKSLAAPPVSGDEFLFESRRALQDGAMQGTSKRSFQQSPGTTDEATWTIRRRLAIDATLAGPDSSWRPEFIGAPAELTASIAPSQKITGKFRFTLYDVSREPGVALNYLSGTGLDLRFADEQPVKFSPPAQTADGWTIESAESLQDATVRVVAFDYGAWGRLKAQVNVDGEWYDCIAANGRASVTVPVDENENHIADTWERDKGVWGKAASSDEDEEPPGASSGDGFSIYEEYRGFRVGSDWVTTDPARKEIFIVDEVGEGIGYFAKTGVVPLLIDKSGYRESDRVVNFNAGHATRGPQKGLRLVAEALDGGVMGQVVPAVGIPNAVEKIVIDTFELALTTDPDATPSTLAHELSHAIDVQHHGDYLEKACGTAGLIAVWRGAHGGDRGCFMAYSNASQYIGWDKRCYPYIWPDQFGTDLCSSKAGTGFNAGERRMEDGHPMPVSGDAAVGNCRAAIRLR